MDTAKSLLGKLPVASAELLRSRLAKDGVTVETIHNKMTCNSGCSSEVEIWSHPEDIDAIKMLMSKYWNESVEGTSQFVAQASSIYDPERDEAICPACGTQFKTDFADCPECGLSFGVNLENSNSKSCSSGKCK